MKAAPHTYLFTAKEKIPRLRLVGAEKYRHLTPFDLSGAMETLVHDIATRCPDFSHVDAQRILFTLSRARNRTKYGLQAKIIPLRFENGDLRGKVRGRWYYPQRYKVGATEILYHISFCVPRFLDNTFEQKLVTVIHELYHISPEMNGDIRRLVGEGRYSIHSKSQKDFDARMAEYAKEYFDTKPDPKTSDFLRLDWKQFEEQHGGIVGINLPAPKIIPAKYIEESSENPH